MRSARRAKYMCTPNRADHPTEHQARIPVARDVQEADHLFGSRHSGQGEPEGKHEPRDERNEPRAFTIGASPVQP